MVIMSCIYILVIDDSVYHAGIYTHSSLKNYRSLEAHNFFTSGFVGVVLHHKLLSSDTYLFQCDVKPSWRVTEKPHQTWVPVKGAGTIVATHCNCMAGYVCECVHSFVYVCVCVP